MDFPIEACGEDLLRELCAFYRVDGVLVVSEWEQNFLREKASFPAARLLLSPLFTSVENNLPAFSERAHLCFLGNYRHGPNLDGIEWFIEKIWPKTREIFPDMELHLYGAYPPASISKLHKKMGIQALGPVDDHREMLKKYRALIAPLRFGAGIKGKVLEAWSCGTPVLGTPIAFEGMGVESEFFTDEKSFISIFGKIYTSEENWTTEQRRFHSHAQDFFSPQIRGIELLAFIDGISKNITKIRSADLIGQMLRHQSNNSTKYFSRWIEEKNKKAGS